MHNIFSEIAPIVSRRIRKREESSSKPMGRDDDDDKRPDNIVWVEGVILNSLEGNTGIEALKKSQSKVKKSSASRVDNKILATEGTKSHQSVASMEELKISICEIEMKDESFLGDDRMKPMSRIVSGKIKYFIENRDDSEEKFQYWIIKMPTFLQPNRNLLQITNAAKREIAFYTQILQDIKMWVDSRYIDELIEFRVPTCYYGKYLRPLDKTPDLDIISHILDSESLLVLDDMRVYGFGKRHFGSGLLMSEAMAAIEEIVKFHAITWAMQELDGGKLSWSNLYEWKDFGNLYYTLIDNEFISFQKFIRESRHPKAREIQVKMAKLRPHLLNKLYNLLVPAECPFPNTLVHMDFWSENILFKMKDEDRENEVPIQEADLDCCIIDWQMVSYGRPTHDLALLMMLSLEPEDRREHGTILLQYYYERFRVIAEHIFLNKYEATEVLIENLIIVESQKIVECFDLTLPFDYAMLEKEFTNSCVLAVLMAMASIEVVTMEESTQHRFFEALADLIEENLL